MPFRAIVIGGGPVGLVAAHCFAKAGLDFIILERQPTIVADLGASIVIGPATMRVFAQLGILDDFFALSYGLKDYNTSTLDGRLMKQNKICVVIGENHGSRPRCCHRADFIRLMYEALPESVKDHFLVNKNVIGLETSDNGVIAHCADGTSHEGSIIVGADGIGSRARRTMTGISANPKEPFIAQYRCFTAQLMQTDQKAWLFLYERLEAAVSRGDATTYTDADIDALVRRWGHAHIDANTTAKQLFEQRFKAGMTNVDEGTVPKWSAGRTVLVGDSAHKMTPNFAQGFNNGVQDVVALTNELCRLLGSENTENPTTEALRLAFERYERTRLEHCQDEASISSQVLRMSAWANFFNLFLDRVVLPALSDRMNEWLFTRMTAPSIRRGLVLDCVECDEPFTGRIPWENAIRQKKA
ncbi:hypothetical protein GGR57DRAFT_495659 [Xylariaceae sp. FL1272]|nr:hypothetical protein GGR57DRAFT_495659 [Xylariaceae sp. FL1272]